MSVFVKQYNCFALCLFTEMLWKTTFAQISSVHESSDAKFETWEYYLVLIMNIQSNYFAVVYPKNAAKAQMRLLSE